MKAGFLEVAHGFWRRPDVAALCERLGAAAGAFVLMAEAYALESLPDGDFSRVSRETLASRCWFCGATEAGTIHAALVDLGFLVNGKLAGWEEKVAKMRAAKERMSQGGRNRARQMWGKKEPAAVSQGLLDSHETAAGDEKLIAKGEEARRTPFIQAENPVSGAGAGGGESSFNTPHTPLAPVAPTPAPVNPFDAWKAEQDGRDEVPPAILFGPLPPWRFPKDREAIREQIDDLLKDAKRIKERAIAHGRDMNPQELADYGAYQKRILQLKALLKGVVPPEPSPAPSPAPKTKTPRRSRK